MQNYSGVLDVMIVVVYWKMVGGASGKLVAFTIFIQIMVNTDGLTL